MPDLAATTVSTVIPCLRYRDAPAMIEWLCTTFGFEKHLVVPGEGDTIAHAQLRFGNGMVMLGSAETEFSPLIVQPSEVGGRETQCAYVVCRDADEMHARVVAAGMPILLPLKTEDYGGRGFTCRDPEGHTWSFGTYDPWA